MHQLPSSLLGFATFKAFEQHLINPFTATENVFVQTVAVAVGTMPLAAGLVGVIPALEIFLTPDEQGPLRFSIIQLITWSFGLAFFGVFFAVPLRKQVVVREKLPFPSGKATATIISILHNSNSIGETNAEHGWYLKIRALLYSFAISSVYTVTSYFLPILRALPVFDWLTLNQFAISSTWLWSFQPSPAYIGQGIIMGMHTTSSMLFGAILGWGILGPLAKFKGWAPGETDDWDNGSKGWLIWISLAIMLSDCIVSLAVVTVQTIWTYSHGKEHYALLNPSDAPSSKMDIDAPAEHQVGLKMTVIGLLGSSLACIVAVKLVFGSLVPIYAILCAIVLALLLSVLGVRALGETDLNPVSGIGKVSQLLFALIVPRTNPNAIIINLVAGGIAEAGAQQAGDLMQDLKTGHLIGASPKGNSRVYCRTRAKCVAQFYGQVKCKKSNSVTNPACR